MTQQQKIATVFGGTGFIGRLVVRELARKGVTVKVATRVPERAYFLRTNGVVGQIVPFGCDYKNQNHIVEAVKGADYVVNCVGIIFEKRKGDFQRAHAELPGLIATACAHAKVKRLVHVSALGIESGTSDYAKTKRDGEQALLSHFPSATILRPSIVFGEDDSFFNKFAKLARLLPTMILIGGGHTRFQPVFAGDVAQAVIAALTLPSIGDHGPEGKVFELGGPEIVTFREIYERLFHYTKQPRRLFNVSFRVAKMQACFLSLLPDPILTRDQVESLKTDSVVSGQAYTLEHLGVVPTAMDVILPTYLSSYKPGGRFADRKAA